jgi:uncharacterized membrane protein YgdD (TMEM256/DUF423 family)
MRLSAPTQMIFYVSIALAIISLVIRALVLAKVSMPLFPTGGYLILLVGYLVLLTGVTLKRA